MTDDPNGKVIQLDRGKTRLDAGADGGNGSSLGERLAKLETRMDYLATKEDISQEAKSTFKWFVGTLIAACGVSIAAITLFVVLITAYFSSLSRE